MDYGYGKMDLSSNQKLTPRASKFLNAADAEIEGANSQLLQTRINHKAILSLRMANEIFLKVVLVQELDVSSDHLRKISHNLKVAAEKCAEITDEKSFEDVARCVKIYPPVSARYDQWNWSSQHVWEAVKVAQLTAAAVTRLYSDRDMRRDFPIDRDG